METTCISNSVMFLETQAIQSVPEVRHHRRTLLFDQIRRNVTREMLQITRFHSQMLQFVAYVEPLRRYTLYIIINKKLRPSCHSEMKAKEGCLFRVESVVNQTQALQERTK